MKKKILLRIALLFFLIINTTYFWEGRLDLLFLPVMFLLVLVFLVLLLALFRQLFWAFREKFSDNRRLILIGVLTFVVTGTLFKPTGLMNFDRLHGKDLFVAEHEGAANCLTTVRLKEDNTFVERSVCFGVREIKGEYELRGDTILFKNTGLTRQISEFYEYGIVNLYDSENMKYCGELRVYENHSDTTGFLLWILKNDLIE